MSRESIPESETAEIETPAADGHRLFRALIAYDGARFHGFQFQPDLATVQGEIERAILQTSGQALRIQGAGRTDAGVHALGQVVSFGLATRLEADRLRLALNSYLSRDIRVLQCEEAPPGFAARFSAVWREYRYLLAKRESPFLRGRAYVPRRGRWPDLDLMNPALRSVLGERDFRGFTTQPEGPYGCQVLQARWWAWNDGLVFGIRSNRFLYQMVRILVGTCLQIGLGRRSPRGLAEVLAARDRRAAGPLAPACGLYLAAVGYTPPWPGSADGPVDLPVPVGPWPSEAGGEDPRAQGAR